MSIYKVLFHSLKMCGWCLHHCRIDVEMDYIEHLDSHANASQWYSVYSIAYLHCHVEYGCKMGENGRIEWARIP